MTTAGTPPPGRAPTVMNKILAALLLGVLAGTAGSARADADTRVFQQRLADGRVVLSDRPIEGVAVQRSWQIAREDPQAARQRSENVRREAEQVAERIQRRLDREQASAMQLEADRLRSNAAESRRARELARDEEREPTVFFVPGLLQRQNRSMLPIHRPHLRTDRQDHRPQERPRPGRPGRNALEELR